MPLPKANKDKNKKPADSLLTRLADRVRAMVAAAPVKSSVALSLIAAIAFVTLAGLFGWHKYVVQERNRQVQAFSEQNARAAASNLASYLRSLEEKLAYFAGSRSLHTALAYNDPAGRNEMLDAVANTFPSALAIRMFAKGEARVDLQAEPPLRFSELELIRRAEQRQPVIPEALNIGNESWRVNLIVPVPSDPAREVVGTLMVTLPMGELYERLRAELGQTGRVALYQTFENKPRLINSFGEGDLFVSERIPVTGTPWQVEYTASPQLFKQTNIDYSFLMLVSIIAACTVIAIFLTVGLVVGRNMQRKQQALAETHARMGRVAGAGSQQRQDILDIVVMDEDAELLGLSDADAGQSDLEPLDISDALEVMDADDRPDIPAHVFRSYDIRGLAENEITPGLAQKIGQALGSEAMEQGEHTLIVARDARLHSPLLAENLIRGILSTGCKVLNIGTVPTPLLYFATETLKNSSSGVMVTASHNPAEFNGFKVVMKGKPRMGSDIQAIRTRILSGSFRQGIGLEEHKDCVTEYIDTIFSDVALAGEVSVVIDAANGVAGKVAPRLFEELGCQVTPLYCDLDGSFPHHGPDPSIAENLTALIAKVKEVGADIGVAFDGDGDRLAVVTPKGQIIWPDRLLMLFARDILARNPGGDVVFDVKSSRLLNEVITSQGGRPIMWRTGHAPMRTKVMETGALIGGEFSGHIFIKDRWFGFDDGLYAAARLIEIMSLRDESLDEIFAEFPQLEVTPEIRIAVPEAAKFDLVERLKQQGEFGEAKLVTIDGVRIEFPYGWALVRSSNTSAHLTLRFEAETKDQIHSLKALVTREIRKLDSTIEFNWR